MDESKAQDQVPASDDTLENEVTDIIDQSADQLADQSGEGAAKPAAAEPERIAKYLSRSGICSRRDAERWIAERRVKVNGVIIDTPVILVTEADRIVVDGNAVEGPDEPRLFRYHKPSGLVTTNRDELGRETIFDQLPQNMPRVMTVGRLDINTEGLLLLTNDGEVARQLELPDTGWTRRYKVRAFGMLTDEHVNALRKGPTIDGIRYAPAKVDIERQQGSNCWLTLTLKEGKNREVKRLLEYCGLKVNRLIRLSYGPFQLGNLEVGAVEEVKRHILKEQIPGFTDRLKGTKASDRKAAADTRARLEDAKSSQKTTKPATTRKIKANRPVSEDDRAPWQGGHSAPRDRSASRSSSSRSSSSGASSSRAASTRSTSNNANRPDPRGEGRAEGRDNRRDNRGYGYGEGNDRSNSDAPRDHSRSNPRSENRSYDRSDDRPDTRSEARPYGRPNNRSDNNRSDQRPARPYKDRAEGNEGRASSYRDRDTYASRDRGTESARPAQGKKLVSPYATLKNKGQSERSDYNDRPARSDRPSRSDRPEQTRDNDRPYRSRSDNADRSQDRPRQDRNQDKGQDRPYSSRPSDRPASRNWSKDGANKDGARSSPRPSTPRSPSRPDGGGRPPRGRRDS